MGVKVPVSYFNRPIAEELYKTIQVYCGRMGCEVIELNGVDTTERVGIEAVRNGKR